MRILETVQVEHQFHRPMEKSQRVESPHWSSPVPVHQIEEFCRLSRHQSLNNLSVVFNYMPDNKFPVIEIGQLVFNPLRAK